MFEKILVATDGSPNGMKAVETAADLAVKYGSELIVFHVLLHGEPPSAFRRMAEIEHLIRPHPVAKPGVANVPGGLVAFAAASEESRINHDIIDALGDRIVDQSIEAAKAKGVEKVSSETAEGDSANRILKAAEKDDVDLIVLGSRGFGPIKSLFVGSVSQKVGQLAHCATLTVK